MHITEHDRDYNFIPSAMHQNRPCRNLGQVQNIQNGDRSKSNKFAKLENFRIKSHKVWCYHNKAIFIFNFDLEYRFDKVARKRWF